MNKIKELLSQYEGNLEIKEKEIVLTDINQLKDKKVKCEISIKIDYLENYKYSLSAEEKTYEILGGVSMPLNTEEEVIKHLNHLLTRYSFNLKEQLDLFRFNYWKHWRIRKWARITVCLIWVPKAK